MAGWQRRIVVAFAAGWIVFAGVFGAGVAHAAPTASASASPFASASASASGSASPSPDDEGDDDEGPAYDDTPDAAPDNTRTVIALVGAAGIAVIAAVIVVVVRR